MDLTSIVELIKLIIPATAVIIAVQYVLNSFKEKELKNDMIQLQGKSIEIVLPLRLQAYERMCMYLERLRLDAVIMRVHNPAHTPGSFQKAVLDEIRKEFTHNLSQQVYLSENAWNLIKNATEASKSVVISSFQEVNFEGATGSDFAKKALDKYFSYTPNPIDEALNFIKREIQEKF